MREAEARFTTRCSALGQAYCTRPGIRQAYEAGHTLLRCVCLAGGEGVGEGGQAYYACTVAAPQSIPGSRRRDGASYNHGCDVFYCVL